MFLDPNLQCPTHVLPTTHKGPTEPINGAVALASIGTHAVGHLLRSIDLCLEGCSVVVDPLELMKVSIENTDHLADLFCELS